MSAPPKVFISYSHDSPEHADRVLALADRLRADGLDAIIDQYEPHPPEGWPLWMDRQIRECDFVLMVCTPTYNRRVMGQEQPGIGHGVRWEGNLIYQHIYNAATRNEKFVPILLEGGQFADIPTPVQGHSYFRVDTDDGYTDLYRLLTQQPAVVKPALGTLKPMPPRQREHDVTQEPLQPVITQQPRVSLSPTERLKFIQRLNGLPSVQLDVLIFTLNPPPGSIPPSSAPQGDRVAALLQWAEGTGGCGLAQVRETLEAILNPT